MQANHIVLGRRSAPGVSDGFARSWRQGGGRARASPTWPKAVAAAAHNLPAMMWTSWRTWPRVNLHEVKSRSVL